MLNAKQQRFADEWLKVPNATQAAVRAGYSEKTAYSIGQRLLKNVEIKKYIREAQAKRAEAVKIDQQWVLTRLIEVAERCMQREELFDKDGKSLGEWKFEHAGANKALELIGKHLGMFIERIKVEDDSVIEIRWINQKENADNSSTSDAPGSVGDIPRSDAV